MTLLLTYSENIKVRREVADYIKPMQAAAMSLVSGTTLMIGAAKNALTNPSDRSGAVLVTRSVYLLQSICMREYSVTALCFQVS